MLDIIPVSGEIFWKGYVSQEYGSNNVHNTNSLKYRTIPNNAVAPIVANDWNGRSYSLSERKFAVIGEIGDFYQLENGWYVEKDQKNITYSISK